jgi:putative hydrolase of HD superfamily
MSCTDSSVGDITPVEGVPAHVKHQLEEEAMDAFLNEMLGGEGNKEAKARFRSLWDVSSDPLRLRVS